MIILRKLEKQDYDNLIELFTSQDVRKYLGGSIALEDARDNATKVIEKCPDYIHVIEHAGDMVGTISFGSHVDTGECEVSYQLLPRYWGQGYAQQALKLAFSQIEGKIVAETQVKNLRSRKLLGRLGFKEVRTLERFDEDQVLCELIR